MTSGIHSVTGSGMRAARVAREPLAGQDQNPPKEVRIRKIVGLTLALGHGQAQQVLPRDARRAA